LQSSFPRLFVSSFRNLAGRNSKNLVGQLPMAGSVQIEQKISEAGIPDYTGQGLNMIRKKKIYGQYLGYRRGELSLPSQLRKGYCMTETTGTHRVGESRLSTLPRAYSMVETTGEVFP